MKCSSPTKEMLCSVRKYDLAAEEAMLNYEALRSEITRITPSYTPNYSSTKCGLNTADIASSVALLEDAAQNVLKKVERYTKAKVEVIEIISAMGTWPEEMKCLRLRYLTYHDNKEYRLLSWDSIADLMHCSRKQAINIHGRALQHFNFLWQKAHR